MDDQSLLGDAKSSLGDAKSLLGDEQVTHPFKGLLPPPGTILQVGAVIHGFWHVENNIVAHTHYDRANHGEIPGDAESSPGDTLRARWVTLRARWVTLRARRVTR
jgi:hypothetical protein